ncbi:spore photoproduct lyase [Dethiobacter alkaliphilus]|uniref:Radical SAM domain protein n=1 Tax=Dethiobacter alkaliphilus AHT 1 TaxID=555088 RepID=C0GCG5_DETAL|nr:spore photoproduct lyase [Dethiobacter alkaliphilus]EEG78900.1 Radical SAM domain protein [Dethiobacter alkaliphilus AHT 1]
MTNNTCFAPQRVLFEERALDYPLGRSLWERFRKEDKEVRVIGSHNRVTGLPGKDPAEKFKEAKRTLVVGVKKDGEFAKCRPSADFQLVLSTSCPGMCEYCYLHTTLGRQPVVRLYVNVEEILERAEKVIKERAPEETVFEGAATSDPLPLEPYSGALAQAITFFAKQEHARFRFVTKFTCVDSLLDLKHQGKTEFRFSVNTPEIINRFEHGTPRLTARLQAAAKVFQAGYKLGFLVAPIFLYDGWQKSYEELLLEMKDTLPAKAAPSFELITHRFTARGKQNIAAIFPSSELPLSEEERRFKYGQFGYGKYVYTKEQYQEAERYLSEKINVYFPSAEILYFV